ncbi:MAG: hypothetical protein UW41_C0016G0026 [Candidatus Collierbacteria bacterium GW2011_GWC2_44_18]|uniref:Uncharacterized protein n=2 Tax=Microgenomates group TaxID=1794810 RepID=A0A0G1J793_9BACT|nr:MAG: hypothetical protein UW16_C0027G0010 [Microgenomates group bacterium GW2011_GWC1_44_10]KKT48889.1 MAG: hypothetical protein UW41_C0016G0026 [Candidatus Collierbacteria bacterium GW2011_GWC2_44_18]KKT67213.1 MAG: hypothetical protein UW60_C0011G0013 [Candidatus Woesebacteria bacterium GW2011_GWA2_44_33]
MGYDIFDIRVVTLQSIKSFDHDGQLAYLSGLLWGLRVSVRWLEENGCTSYNDEVGAFFQARPTKKLFEIVDEWNSLQKNGLLLSVGDSFGGIWRLSKEAEVFFTGFEAGLQYVPKLYWSLADGTTVKAKTIILAKDYVREIRNWVRVTIENLAT